MLKQLQQTGSSTTGLLTASAIFIALLVYTNQYAFNNSNQGIFSSLFSSDSEPEINTAQTANAEGNTGTIRPLHQGIFETATIAENNNQETIGETTETVVSAASENNSATSNKEVSMTAVQVQAQMQAVAQGKAMPVSYAAVNPSQDQASMYTYQGYYTGLNGNQFYTTDARSNGQGRGRGSMKGDGEFNFSMKFKSRARMDADADMNADSSAYGNAYQQHLYNQNTAAYPVYGYHYYRY